MSAPKPSFSILTLSPLFANEGLTEQKYTPLDYARLLPPEMFWEAEEGKMIVSHEGFQLLGRLFGVEIEEARIEHFNANPLMIIYKFVLKGYAPIHPKLDDHYMRPDIKTTSFGEASASNLETDISRKYPSSIAQKRGFDRAMKDHLGLYGIYSEEESDAFRRSSSNGTPTRSAGAQSQTSSGNGHAQHGPTPKTPASATTTPTTPPTQPPAVATGPAHSQSTPATPQSRASSPQTSAPTDPKTAQTQAPPVAKTPAPSATPSQTTDRTRAQSAAPKTPEPSRPTTPKPPATQQSGSSTPSTAQPTTPKAPTPASTGSSVPAQSGRPSLPHPAAKSFKPTPPPAKPVEPPNRPATPTPSSPIAPLLENPAYAKIFRSLPKDMPKPDASKPTGDVIEVTVSGQNHVSAGALGDTLEFLWALASQIGIEKAKAIMTKEFPFATSSPELNDEQARYVIWKFVRHLEQSVQS